MPVFADLLPESTDVIAGLEGFDPSSFSGLGSFGLNTMSTPYLICCGILTVWGIICLWKMFKKAGLPGWGSLIPIYNIVLWFKMAGRSGRRTLSLLCPPLFVIMIIVSYFDIAKRFGKSGRFGLGLWFLGPIFSGILAFGKAQYHHK